jgi:hypothetical protein
MRKLILAITSACFFFTVQAQVDFNGEFDKIMKLDRQATAVLSQLENEYGSLQVRQGLTEKESVVKSSFTNTVTPGEKINILKKAIGELRDSYVSLFRRAFGKSTNTNLADFQSKVIEYAKLRMLDPACLGCKTGCMARYFQCIDAGVHENLCNAMLELCYYECNVNHCPIDPS